MLRDPLWRAVLLWIAGIIVVFFILFVVVS